MYFSSIIYRFLGIFEFIINEIEIRNNLRNLKNINKIKIKKKIKELENIITNFNFDENIHKAKEKIFIRRKYILHTLKIKEYIIIESLQILKNDEHFVSKTNMKPENFLWIKISFFENNKWKSIENNFTDKEKIYLINQVYLKIKKHYIKKFLEIKISEIY